MLETLLNISTKDTVELLGYNYYSLSRSGKRGGGFDIYLYNTFTCSLITEFFFLKDSIECIFIEIVSETGPNVLVASVFRPSGSDVNYFNYEFSSLLSVGKK